MKMIEGGSARPPRPPVRPVRPSAQYTVFVFYTVCFMFCVLCFVFCVLFFVFCVDYPVLWFMHVHCALRVCFVNRMKMVEGESDRPPRALCLCFILCACVLCIVFVLHSLCFVLTTLFCDLCMYIVYCACAL